MVKACSSAVLAVVTLAGYAATFVHCAYAEDIPADEVRVGRYSYIAPVATAEQANPLNVVVSLKLPQQIENVGTAIEFLLQRSGYRLAKNVNQKATALLYDLDIPAVHRDLGPITLANALQTLTGPEWDLKINKLTRKITFFARYEPYPAPYPSGSEDDEGAKGEGPLGALDGDLRANSNF